MTREDLVDCINQEIEARGGKYSMTKHDVAVFCYNLGVEIVKNTISFPKEIDGLEPLIDKLKIKDKKSKLI